MALTTRLPQLAPTLQRVALPALTRLVPMAARTAARAAARHASTRAAPIASGALKPAARMPAMQKALGPMQAADASMASRTFARNQSTASRTFARNQSTFNTGPGGGGQRFNTGGGGGGNPFGDMGGIPKIEMPSINPRYAAIAGGLAFGLYCAKNSVLMTDAGVTYVVQNQITGSLEVYTEPGLHGRVPFFSSVTPYRQVITSTFESKNKRNDETNAADTGSVTCRFADTYMGYIPVTFRFKMPNDPTSVRKMHKEFRSESNLVQALLMRNAANVTVITATQYTGEEFFQGGLNQFKTQLADQLQNGVYLTERKQVEVEQTDLAPVGADQDPAGRGKLIKAKQLVWKTVPVLDESGHLQRGENPLAQYGIEVTQVLIGDPRPEENLDRLLLDKKRLVAERIKTVQEQETSKAQARTEQLKKEIQRTKEVQDAQRQKELVVISSQREVEVAKQVAERETIEQRKLQDLAVINKEKELAIARAELDIQKANAMASQHQAQAITAKGKAEADVLAAMYKAKAANKEIFLAETQRDIAQTMYSNLKDFKVEMPHNVIVGAGSGNGNGGDGAGKMPSNLDVITAFSALGLMEKARMQEMA